MERRSFYHQPGFSLIELAVVLIIIGVMIGGLWKGQELIESARLKKVITQVNDYRSALQGFMDRYDALPGDFSEATAVLSADVKDGNGNGKVEGKGLEKGSEALQFWAHLGAAGLVQGVTIKMPDKVLFGRGLPSAPLGGGFTVEENPGTGMEGLWFILGTEEGDQGVGGGLTPLQAQILNKKMDDGSPVTGNVRSLDASGQTGKCLSPQNTYNTSHKEKSCVMYFRAL